MLDSDGFGAFAALTPILMEMMILLVAVAGHALARSGGGRLTGYDLPKQGETPSWPPRSASPI
jgi:hypothetical protein